MTKEFLKGLLMTLVSVVVVAFNTTPVVWSVLVITLIGTVVLYFGKNAITLFKSDSKPLTLSLINIASALFIAVGTGIIQAIATVVINGVINWAELGKVVLAVTFTYLSTTLFAGKNTEVK